LSSSSMSSFQHSTVAAAAADGEGGGNEHSSIDAPRTDALGGTTTPSPSSPLSSVQFLDVGGYAFKHSYARIFSGHDDGSICIWDVRLHEPDDVQEILRRRTAVLASSSTQQSLPVPASPGKSLPHEDEGDPSLVILTVQSAPQMSSHEAEQRHSLQVPTTFSEKWEFVPRSVLRGHQRRVTSFAVSEDKHTFWSADELGVVIQWAVTFS
jgi:WD40 repeat protein